MRDSAPGTVLAGSVGWSPTLSSWSSSGDLLAEDIPVLNGRLYVDAALQVPERLTFTVPEFAAARSWVPDAIDHPLAHYGQIVDLDINVTSSVTREQWQTRIGRYQIQDWVHDDANGLVRIEALSLLQIALDDGFPQAPVPRVAGTLTSELRRLLPDGLGLTVSPSLANRPVPQTFQWSKNRLQCLYDIAAAWPARLRVDQYGTLQALPPLPAVASSPVITFTDGRRGTLVSAPQEGSRDNVYNAVYGTATATDDPARAPIVAVAQRTYGPTAVGTYRRVSTEYSTALATTQAQLQAATEARLNTLLRPAVVQRVVCAPDPRVEVDDVLQIVRDGVPRVGYVVGYDLPLTVEDGAMTVMVGVNSA